jgi:hypothetical protein
MLLDLPQSPDGYFVSEILKEQESENEKSALTLAVFLTLAALAFVQNIGDDQAGTA